MKRIKKLSVLFINMLYISAFTFGGGFAIVSLMKKKFVDEFHWIEDNEMLDLIGISESCPGAITVNAALLVGYKIDKYLGMFVSLVATILPPLFIISIISLFYASFCNNEIIKIILKGMQASVAAIIINVTINLGNNIFKDKNILKILIFIVAFASIYIFSINVIYIILTSIFLGIIIALKERRETNK